MEKPAEGEPLSHPLEQQPEPPPPPPGEKRFRLWYVGSACLDRRTTLPMLPWLMAEIRRRGQRQEPGGALGGGVPAREVLLLLGSPTLRCVPAGPASPGPGRPASPAPAVFIFEHKAQHIARFIHNSHDLTYFAYLIKAQPDNPDSPMACHVFRATDPNQASGAAGRGQCLGPRGAERPPPRAGGSARPLVGSLRSPDRSVAWEQGSRVVLSTGGAETVFLGARPVMVRTPGPCSGTLRQPWVWVEAALGKRQLGKKKRTVGLFFCLLNGLWLTHHMCRSSSLPLRF